MKKMKIKNKRKMTIFVALDILYVIVSLLFLGLIFWLDILPTKYFVGIVTILMFFNVVIGFFLVKKNVKKKVKKIFSAFCILNIVVMLFMSFYLYRTLGFFWSINNSDYRIEKYSVVVLKDSKYSEIKDIKGVKLGYYSNSAGYKLANKKLEKVVSVKFNKYDDILMLGNSLLDKKVKAIVVEDSMKKVLEEEIESFNSKTKVIYTFSIKTKVDNSAKDVNVTQKPFIIYLSGIDTYGEISSVSRSDVNIVMVVNPKTKQILLTSIPRDYYVQLNGTTGNRDKLTHAGLYGVNKSISTIEDLLDIEINYYFKVNFTSVVEIVNSIGKINVYSDYAFTSQDGYKYAKGYNEMNGEQALSFARERHAFKDGDRQRGKDQQAVIEAIIRKASNKSIITKYSSLLDSITGKFQTNMGTGKMTSLIKMQLKDMSKWTVTSFSLNGADGSEYTYSCGSQKLYVMLPYKDSIDQAKELIESVLGGEKLSGSYVEYTGTTNVVVQPSKKTTTIETKSNETITNNIETKEEKKNKYTVKFYDEKAGNLIKSVIVNEGDSVTVPSVDEREGFKFVGWKDSITNQLPSLSNIQGDINIYASWEDLEESQQTTNPDPIETVLPNNENTN